MSTKRVPPISETEIELLLIKAGHPGESDRLKTQAKVINIQTSGHPQLVQARVEACKAKGWPGIRLEDFAQTPPEIALARTEARQLLVEELSEEQKNVLYRLSIVGVFRRDHAMEIGRQSGVSAPGDILDSLMGPWIEPITVDYYRVSPLLSQAANEAWDHDAVTALHADIASALLKCKNLSIYEAQNIFMHAFVGRHAGILLVAINGIVAAKDEVRTAMFKELSWLLAVRTGPGKMLFPENLSVNAALRMLQFKIAVETEPAKASLFVDLWDKELSPHDPRKMYLLERYVFVLHVLMYYQVKIRASDLVDRLEEMDAIETALPEIREKLGKLDFSESRAFGVVSPFDSLKLFFCFMPARCHNAAFLRDLVRRLSIVPPVLRDRMLSAFRESASFSTMLVDKAWLTEAGASEPNWASCIDVLHEVGRLAKEMNVANLAFASARAVGIIYDEYLDAPDKAFDELNAVEKEQGSSPILNDQRATIMYRKKDYSGALTVWEKDLTIRPSTPPIYDVSIWTYRKAGISAAFSGDWLKAAHLFKEGYERAVLTDIPWTTVGLIADAGFAYWKAGRPVDSLHALQAALLLFERIPDAQTDFKSFSVGKLLGSVLVWIKRSLLDGVGDKGSEPLPGMCSNPDPNERLKDLPVTLGAYCWPLLAEIEYDIGIGTSIFEYVIREFERSEYVLVRMLIGTLRIRYSIRNGFFGEIPSYSFIIARSMTAGRAVTETGKTPFVKISATEFQGALAPSEMEFVEHTMMQALICAASSNVCQAVLDDWERQILGHTHLTNLAGFIRTARHFLLEQVQEAYAAMRDVKVGWQTNTLAALRIAVDDDATPEDIYQAHSILLRCVRQGVCERESSERLAEMVNRKWIALTRHRALLRSPMTTVPAIERACGENRPGMQKIASILYAAARAVSMHIPDQVIKDLEALRASRERGTP